MRRKTRLPKHFQKYPTICSAIRTKTLKISPILSLKILTLWTFFFMTDTHKSHVDIYFSQINHKLKFWIIFSTQIDDFHTQLVYQHIFLPKATDFPFRDLQNHKNVKGLRFLCSRRYRNKIKPTPNKFRRKYSVLPCLVFFFFWTD